MKNTKLYRVLNTFSKIEIREFKKFLQSPAFNQRKDVQELLRLILLYQNKKKIPQKSIFYQQLFPDEPYDSTRFDLLVSYLYKRLEHFLAWQEWEKEPISVGIQAAKNLTKRGLFSIAAQHLDKLEQTNLKGPYRDTRFMQNNQEIQWLQYQITDTNQPVSVPQTWRMSETLDHFYLAEKLKHYCLLLAYQKVYPSSYELNNIDYVLSKVENDENDFLPILRIYYACSQMLQFETKSQHFDKFNQLLSTLPDKLPTEEFRTLLLMGINYCVKKINDGDRVFLEALLRFYEMGLRTESLLENGYLTRITYHNIVGTGLNNQELDWTADFIKKYKNHLQRKYRESSYSFNLARLAYYQKDYDKVLELLQKSNYRDTLLNLAAKVLLLKVYAEQDEDDLLFSHLDAMQKYLQRKRIIGYHRENYSNIILFTRRLRSISFLDQRAIEILKESIEKEQILTEKEWLLKQLVQV